MNNKGWQNIEEICEYIRLMPNISDNESLEEKAWRFAVMHSEHATPYSKEEFLHNPQVFFNSLGYGICDDMSWNLAFIWKELGYNARVCYLDGHVVPEVQIKGEWGLYDPSIDVYYTKNGRILGVEDLAENSDIILYPDSIVGNKLNFRTAGKYNVSYAKLYDQKQKHSFCYIPKIKTFNAKISLPPNSSFEFPGIYWDNSTFTSKIKKGFSVSGKLVIEGDFSGSINLPFLPVQINGFGNVSINNKEFVIGSKELNNMLLKPLELINEMVFVNAKKC